MRSDEGDASLGGRFQPPALNRDRNLDEKTLRHRRVMSAILQCRRRSVVCRYFHLTLAMLKDLPGLEYHCAVGVGHPARSTLD